MPWTTVLSSYIYLSRTSVVELETVLDLTFWRCLCSLWIDPIFIRSWLGLGHRGLWIWGKNRSRPQLGEYHLIACALFNLFVNISFLLLYVKRHASNATNNFTNVHGNYRSPLLVAQKWMRKIGETVAVWRCRPNQIRPGWTQGRRLGVKGVDSSRSPQPRGWPQKPSSLLCRLLFLWQIGRASCRERV